MAGEGRCYRHFPAKFMRAVRGIGPDVIGAYSVILALIYEDEDSCPNDPRWLAGILGCSGRKAAALIQELLRRGLLVSDSSKRLVNAKSLGVAKTSPNARVPMSAAQRSLIFERDGTVCLYCGNSDGPFEIDHVFPVARGGRDALENLAVACRPCNRSKGAKTIEEWVR